jgi:hypothetical protein|tara:strand:+ start:348 stop:1655 length:1308 start_codon:yes stop_codon:yes gene_type:complete
MANNPITSLFSSAGSFGNKSSNTGIDEIKMRMQSARVVDISLNSDSTMWVGNGEWGGIGTIQFQLFDVPTQQKNSSQNKNSNTAKPLFPHIKNYPLVNETVLIFQAPNTEESATSNKKTYYYLSTVSLWNSQHANPYPDMYSSNNGQSAPSFLKDYLDIQAGNSRKTTQNPTPIDLNGSSGGTFVEQSNIHPVLPFAGDNIFEGRFGNSLRLGNTAKSAGDIKNNWSNSGDGGSPITILRNGQSPSASSEGWIPVTEDINVDLSSIYLTSTQQIPIEVAVVNKEDAEASTVPFSNTINKTPISPKAYNAQQVVLNSGRLLFNSTADSILISAQKSIVAESLQDLAIKSQLKNVNIIAPNGIVSLGKQKATESVILGDKFLGDFEALLDTISNVFTALSNEPMTPGAGATARLSLDVINPIKDAINSYKSQRVKTS